jgi:hypothetical protein
MLYHYQYPMNESSTTAISDTSTDGRPLSLHTLLNRQRNSDVASLSESEQQILNSGVSVITLAQLQSLLRSQGVATSHDTNNTPPSSTPGWVSVVLLGYLAQLQQQQQQQSQPQPQQPQSQPQRQQQTQQPTLDEDDLLPPNLPFVRLRRPRSGESTSSSTDTIRSMPLSTRSMPLSTRSARSNRSTHSSQYQHRIQPETSLIFILHSTQMLQALSSLSDNPSYEDLLMLGSILGQARAPTTTQAAVDEAIPATQWSETTQKELKGTEQCLVCLDEFVLKQAIRILKCRHVFHRECVDRWLCESHNSCPVCRGVPVS